MDAQDMGNALERILVTEDELARRMAELAAEIDADYQGKEILLVGVLKGAVMVVADLSRHLHTPLSMDWMAVSSYGAGTKSTGVVRILKDLDTDVTGRDVLIVEDSRSRSRSSTLVLISRMNSLWATDWTTQSTTVNFPSLGPWHRTYTAAER